jgi:DNA-binding SARP family transcriptional activator/ATP/maltotriose-dependent transcriptional regulator MalT
VLIPRPRLSEILSSTQVAVVEAPGGYGKSTAYAQLAVALDVATVRVVLRGTPDITRVLSSIALGCRRAGLATLAEAIDVEDPDGTLERFTDRLGATSRRLLLAVDEVHRASPEAATWLATLAEGLPDVARIVIAGRRLGASLADLPRDHGATFVGVDVLRFDALETAAVIEAVRGQPPRPDDVERILAATDGWPAAVVLAAAIDAGTQATVLNEADPGPGVMRLLVDDLLDSAGGGTRALVAAIADLNLLSADVLAAVGGAGALDRLLEAGLPIRFRADGWGELPDPVRELFPPQPLPRDQAREVAALYARRGELAEAAALLHRSGDHDSVASLLASQRREALERGGLAFFDGILNDTPDRSLASHPAALVELIRAAERQARLRRAWIDRAGRVLDAGSAQARAVDAERSLDDARGGDLEGAARTADEVLATAGGDEVVTLGRAHLARALCLLLQDTAGSTGDVAEELELAIGLFDLAGERGWEAFCHQALGYGVHFTTGSFALAAERLEQALALRPAPDAARADTLACLAEVLTHLGRLDDTAVALREAAAIGHRLGDARTVAYAAWSAAELHCQRRDRAAAVAALEDAEANPEGWFDRLAGIDFLAHAAEIRAILGDEEGAWRDLARSEARAAGTARTDAPLPARARLEATFGDPALALTRLDELDQSPLAYRSDRWLRLLLRAVATARLGDRAGAAALVQRARRAAADMGDPDRPARREPELLALADPADRSTAPAAVSVMLLGRFAVERDGVDASPPHGRPATLVKLLALQGTVTVDEAIDLLWPEADIDTGRARLRNLLNRVRAASGEIVGRRDGALTLAPGVAVDAHRFEEEAAAALAAPPEARPGLARGALARSTGELLPADRYADWATVPRERLRRRHLALLDLVAEEAIVRGDLDEADRLLDTGISTDPLEEQRYVRLARALFAQGLARRARRVAEQGVAVAEDLGVEPGEELSALLAQLAERS